jgi:hypothetical protein
VPAGRPLGGDHPGAPGVVQGARHRAGEHVRRTAGVEQVVRSDAGTDRRDRMVVAGDAEHRADGAGRDVGVAEEAGRAARVGRVRQQPVRQFGDRQRIGPRLPGALVDQAGPGGQRRFPAPLAAESVHDPLRNAEPGRARCDALPAGPPQQRGDGRLERPRQSGDRREPFGERRVLLPDAAYLGLAATVEPGDRRSGRPAGGVEQDAALTDAADRDRADHHGAPGRLGCPDGGADQVHGQPEHRGGVELGAPARSGPPRGGLLHE